MHDPAVVDVGQRGSHGRHRGDHLAGTQPPTPGQQVGQAAPGEQVEHQRDLLAVPRAAPHHLVQPDQVRVVEAGEQLGLVHLLLGVAAVQHLHRHRRPAAAGPGPPHLTGATATEPFLQDVAGHDGAAVRAGRPVSVGHGRHGRTPGRRGTGLSTGAEPSTARQVGIGAPA